MIHAPLHSAQLRSGMMEFTVSLKTLKFPVKTWSYCQSVWLLNKRPVVRVWRRRPLPHPATLIQRLRAHSHAHIPHSHQAPWIIYSQHSVGLTIYWSDANGKSLLLCFCTWKIVAPTGRKKFYFPLFWAQHQLLVTNANVVFPGNFTYCFSEWVKV